MNKRTLILFIPLAVLAVAQEPQHRETYRIAGVAAYQRAVDEEKLRDLMLEDIRNAAQGIVDWKLRSQIRHFCAKLPTEE